MFDSIFPTRLRRCLHALVTGLVLAAASLSAQEPGVDPTITPVLSVVGAQGEGADLVVYLNWQASPELPRRATLVVLNGAGAAIAKVGLPVPGPGGLSQVRLSGFLRLIPFLGPSYQLRVLDGAGRPVAPAEPLRVRLSCTEPRMCRFRFDTGVSAPGALVVDWELAGLLDAMPIQNLDLVAWTAARAPQLLGDARTLVWQLDTQPSPGPNPCKCRWVLAYKRPHGRCGNGDELGLEGTFVSAASASISLTREAGIALEQRCWRSAPGSAGGGDEVTVVSGNERFSLRLSRPILSPCEAPCAPSIRYDARLVSRAFAQVDLATAGTTASARWSATLLADGMDLFTAWDEQLVASSGVIGDRTQTDVWTDTAGGLSELILRSEVAADIEVRGRTSYILAAAGVTWRLAARGESTCTKPEGVAAAAVGLPLFAVIPGLPSPSLAHGWDPDTGQIRILSSGECPPGTVP